MTSATAGKHCPIHGEVRQEDIISGYEYSKGQFVVVDPVEVDKLRTEQVVLHGREHGVLLRPMGNVLAMSVLNCDSRVTKPSAFEDDVPKAEASTEEVNLTRDLIKASTARKFDLAEYRDEYTDKLK